MLENGSDYDKLAKLQDQLTQLNQDIDAKTERWEYLSDFVDE